MTRLFFALGGISGGLVVAVGAFGAHVLRDRLAVDMLANFETGVRYQMYHLSDRRPFCQSNRNRV